MLRKSLIKFLFLMVSLLIVNCASQKSITSLNTSDVNPALNSRQPAPMEDNLIAGKPSDVSPVPTVDAEKEVAPIKETGSAIKHATVSQVQPPQKDVSVALGVQFDTGKAYIKPEYHNDIKKIADAMSKYPSTSVVIVGHTDNVGKELVNVKLSYLRATNIKAYLVQKFGIDSSRIRVIGYDYQKPIASNKTAQGRQANRRGETRIETDVSPNSLFSFFEDTNLPIGGFSIVNQESIDAMIKSFKEKQGAASYLSQMVKAPTLELYKMWGGVFSHCAIRIETDANSFYQLELQSLTDLKKAGMKDYHQIGAVISLFGMVKDQMDIVEFNEKNERAKLDNKGPNYATMPICTEKKAARKSTQWYQDCLRSYAGSYNPENALKAGKRTKVFEYEPVTHNCCNFVEEALKACGLEHCFDLGRSTGLDHTTGPLTE